VHLLDSGQSSCCSRVASGGRGPATVSQHTWGMPGEALEAAGQPVLVVARSAGGIPCMAAWCWLAGRMPSKALAAAGWPDERWQSTAESAEGSCVSCGNVSWTRDMSEHSLGRPPHGPRRATTVLEVCISMNLWVLRPRFHKGQWLLDQSLPCGSIMTPALHYGILGTNAGEHSYGDGYGYLSCLPRVPIRCRKP
jgi:hypothetical protein